MGRFNLFIGRMMERLAGGSAPSLFLAAAMLSRSARSGSICLDLSEAAGGWAPVETGMTMQRCPDLASWRSELLKSAVVSMRRS